MANTFALILVAVTVVTGLVWLLDHWVLVRFRAAKARQAQESAHAPLTAEVIEKLKDSLDCNLYFFGSQVNIGTMYMILGITILVLIGIYILLNKSKKYNR